MARARRAKTKPTMPSPTNLNPSPNQSPRTKIKKKKIQKVPRRNKLNPKKLVISQKSPQFPHHLPHQRMIYVTKIMCASQSTFYWILLDLLRISMWSLHCFWTTQQSCKKCTIQLHRILKIEDAYRLRKFYLVEAIRSNLVDKRDKIIAQLHRLEYRV